MEKEENSTTGAGRRRPVRIAITLSGISLVVSVVALVAVICELLPRCNQSFDYLGLLVGLLSLAAVFIVGYQIYNAVAFRRELEAFAKKEETLEQRIREATAEAKDYAKGVTDFAEERSTGFHLSVNSQPGQAFDHYATAYLKSRKIGAVDLAKTVEFDLKSLAKKPDLDPDPLTLFDLAYGPFKAEGGLAERLRPLCQRVFSQGPDRV